MENATRRRALPARRASSIDHGPAGALSTVTSQTAFVVMATASVLGLSLITQLVITRGLPDPADKGLLTLGLQSAFLLSPCLLFGVERAIPITHAGEAMSQTIALAFRAVRVRLLVGLMIGVTATIVGLSTNLGSADMYLTFAGPVAFMAVATSFEVIFRAASVNSGQAQHVPILATSAGILILACVTALWVGNVSLVPMWLVAYGVGRGVIALIFVRRGWNDGPTLQLGSDSGAGLAKLRETGRRLWPASFANYAAFRTDRFLLPLLTGETASLGVYGVIAVLGDLAAGPTEALANVMTPRWRTAALAGSVKTAPILVGALTYLIASVVGISLLGPWLIDSVAGAAYRPTTSLATLLAIASAIFGFNRLLAARATALGATSSVSAAETGGIALAIIGYLALIPRYGSEGAAMGSLVGYSATTIFLIVAGRPAAQS